MPLTSDETIKGHLFPDDVLKLKCPPATKKTEVPLIYYYWAVFPVSISQCPRLHIDLIQGSHSLC